MEQLEVIYGLRGLGQGEDSMIWFAVAKGRFSVSSFYPCLSVKVDAPFPWKQIWFLGRSSKGVFVIMTIVLNRILMINNLIWRRQVFINWCCICC